MTAAFELHPQLAKDGLPIRDLPLCRWLLMNDANYPWTILVPRRRCIREIYELNPSDRAQLALESAAVGRLMMRLYRGDKLNVAALGNVVAQLHLHHIVRFESDPAWPSPVWGRLPPKPYAPAAIQATAARMRKFSGRVFARPVSPARAV